MKMTAYKPKRSKKTIAIVVLLLAGVIIGIIYMTRGKPAPSNGATPGQAATTQPANGTTIEVKKPPVPPVTDPDKPAVGPAGMTRGLAAQIGPSPITTTPVSAQQAQTELDEGLQLYAMNKDLLKARTLVNRAYISGHLAEPQAITARKALADLADRTVLKPDPYVNPKDPYMVSYTFRYGDMLGSRWRNGKLGVIARLGLNVPIEDILMRVNGLSSGTQFKADKSYKMIKGPFHMVVYKNRRAADIFLQDLFVRRIPICVGAAETPTPEGYFRIVRDGRTKHSAYNAPVESGMGGGTLMPGQPGYPLDQLGHNIKIEGISELGTNILASQSYAIHGTNDPTSIGQAKSRGCIRLGEKDIQFVWGALRSYGDPNDPRVTWTRWSTITIRP